MISTGYTKKKSKIQVAVISLWEAPNNSTRPATLSQCLFQGLKPPLDPGRREDEVTCWSSANIYQTLHRAGDAAHRTSQFCVKPYLKSPPKRTRSMCTFDNTHAEKMSCCWFSRSWREMGKYFYYETNSQDLQDLYKYPWHWPRPWIINVLKQCQNFSPFHCRSLSISYFKPPVMESNSDEIFSVFSIIIKLSCGGMVNNMT